MTFARPEAQQQFVLEWQTRDGKERGRYKLGGGPALHAERWSVRRAPDHEDIRWETLHVGRGERVLRSIFINLLIGVLLFFCTTPIAFFNKLHALTVSGEIEATLAAAQLGFASGSDGFAAAENSSASALLGFVQGPASTMLGLNASDTAAGPLVMSSGMTLLQEISTLGDSWPEVIRSMVFDYLPSLIMLGLNLAVLVAMEIPARSFEMKPTHSEIEASIAWRTYAFLLLSMLVMPTVSMDAASTLFFELLGPHAEDAEEHVTQSLSLAWFSSKEGDISDHCATIILQSALVSCAYQLVRVHEVLGGWVLRSLAVTNAEKEQAMVPWAHEYGYHLAYSMLIFVIGLGFSVISPLLLPLTAFYFCTKHCVDKYNLLYVRPQDSGLQNSGAFAENLESFVVIALLAYQLLMSFFFVSRIAISREGTLSDDDTLTMAASIVLVVLVLALLLVSLFLYMGILQTAICPRKGEVNALVASLEKLAQAGERLRNGLEKGRREQQGALRRQVNKVGTALRSVGADCWWVGLVLTSGGVARGVVARRWSAG